MPLSIVKISREMGWDKAQSVRSQYCQDIQKDGLGHGTVGKILVLSRYQERWAGTRHSW